MGSMPTPRPATGSALAARRRGARGEGGSGGRAPAINGRIYIGRLRSSAA